MLHYKIDAYRKRGDYEDAENIATYAFNKGIIAAGFTGNATLGIGSLWAFLIQQMEFL